ncbi:hypothetical protein DM02DRAFT_620994 [Periconia macrospinosa]|uniref:Uncharacterized protein n=1 Tax=Periconia macrospinosa TaxID=97972 RepID=A0A2V1CXU1_9PLEO|nr:hypothetical protein DM02DRAFT_620994 [Periconia macrospinosa]
MPVVSHEFKNIFKLVHQLSLLQAGSMAGYSQCSKVMATDRTVIRKMYDLEYILLQILSAQWMNSHTYSKVDVALAEACHLLFWIGPRGLPPEMKLCDPLVAFIERPRTSFLSPSCTQARQSSLPLPAAVLLANGKDESATSRGAEASTRTIS